MKQILPVSLFGNVWGTVWRICILMLGCKGFTNFQYDRHVATYFLLVFQSPFHPTCSSECNTLTCRQQAKLLLTALYLITIRFLYEDEEPFQFPKWLPSSFGGGSPNQIMGGFQPSEARVFQGIFLLAMFFNKSTHRAILVTWGEDTLSMCSWLISL